jgi:hypothetical protein
MAVNLLLDSPEQSTRGTCSDEKQAKTTIIMARSIGYNRLVGVDELGGRWLSQGKVFNPLDGARYLDSLR